MVGLGHWNKRHVRSIVEVEEALLAEVRAEACADSPAWAVVKKADTGQPDLIVVGLHGRSALGRFVLGSVSQKILTEARCSVRVGRSHRQTNAAPVRLLIGVDGMVTIAAGVYTPLLPM
jgi:nucleotide-binding universal stress UspA family protein